jgi:spermidine/putrescine transport system substrate-binding protein
MPAHVSLAEAGRRVGREVEFEEVSSNEDLEELMAAGDPYDLVFPSDYLIERLMAADALLELDVPAEQLDRLTGWARREPYDPGCRLSVPFAFGTTGYLCDPAKAADDSTWATLFNPSGDGRVGMLDEVREVVGAALIAGGHDPNDVGDEALAAARDLLERQRPCVARYDSDDFTGSVVAGEVVAHQAWSGPASHAVAANPHLRYVVPSDGAIMWVTSAAIPAGAPEPELSRAFLVELMDPDLAARTTLENGYATPNEAARNLLPEEVRARPALFADEKTLARCFRLHDIGAGERLLAATMPPQPRG